MESSEIQRELDRISKMSHIEMASLWRHAPAGHPYFDKRLPLFEAFEKRFRELGGWTPEVSRRVGWD